MDLDARPRAAAAAEVGELAGEVEAVLPGGDVRVAELGDAGAGGMGRIGIGPGIERERPRDAHRRLVEIPHQPVLPAIEAGLGPGEQRDGAVASDGDLGAVGDPRLGAEGDEPVLERDAVVAGAAEEEEPRRSHPGQSLLGDAGVEDDAVHAGGLAAPGGEPGIAVPGVHPLPGERGRDRQLRLALPGAAEGRGDGPAVERGGAGVAPARGSRVDHRVGAVVVSDHEPRGGLAGGTVGRQIDAHHRRLALGEAPVRGDDVGRRDAIIDRRAGARPAEDGAGDEGGGEDGPLPSRWPRADTSARAMGCAGSRATALRLRGVCRGRLRRWHPTESLLRGGAAAQ